MIAAAVAGVTAAAMAVAVFALPGVLACRAAGLRLPVLQRPAAWFAFSLVLLTAAFAACLVAGASLATGAPVLALVTGLACAVLSRGGALAPHGEAPQSRIDPKARSDAKDDAAGPAATAFVTVTLVLAGIAALAASVAFAPLGSVDRWWYLAWVRGYMDAPVLSLEEPFLGSGSTFARFGVHPWLFGLALVSHLAAVDPVVVYEQVAGPLVVVAAISSGASLCTALFGEGRRARLALLACMTLWIGGPLPLLARAGEDKVLAAAVLVPLVLAALLRVLRRGHRGAWILLGAASAATAAVHALDYALVLVVAAPSLLVIAWSDPARRRRTLAALAMLLAIAIAPAVEGWSVRGRLTDIGASLASPDHPVVRVHEGRDRLVGLPFGGIAVHPRLLLHPLALLAIAGAFVLAGSLRSAGRNPQGTAGASHPRPVLVAVDSDTRVLLLVSLAVGLGFAFVPPLPSLAGAVIPPWMVHRVLWILPLGPLAALAALRSSGGRESVAALLLLALGLPPAAISAAARLEETRGRVVTPSDPDFAAMRAAVSALDRDAVLVAAPELAERLPALTGRRVLAGLDRSTVVFAASREGGESRLRARAALLTGASDAHALLAASGLRATHAVFDPRSALLPRCARLLHKGEAFALCELEASGPRPTAAETPTPLAPADSRLPVRAVGGRCVPVAPERRGPAAGVAETRGRDPWSAAPPAVRCLVPVPKDLRGRNGLLLLVDAATGRAADELRVEVLAPGVHAAGSRRLDHGQAVAWALPVLDADAVEIRLASSFLPLVKPRRVELLLSAQ